MKIFLGSDHAGYKLKQQLKRFLSRENITVEDLGNIKYDPQDDYPDYAIKVARKVAETGERGILVCSSGVGVCIVANKIDGIRAVNALKPIIAQRSREDDDTNVLCLAAGYLTTQEAKEIVEVWLNTKFKGEVRHKRRLEKIKNIEDAEISSQN